MSVEKPNSWAPEVVAESHGRWSRNALRFATEAEAAASAAELAGRWWAVTQHRAAPAVEPVNAEWRDGQLVMLPAPTAEAAE